MLIDRLTDGLQIIIIEVRSTTCNRMYGPTSISLETRDNMHM